MSELPRPARFYVGAVIAIGLTLMAVRLPDATFAQPVLFVALLVLSSMTAALKVHLPLTTSGSTMSVSYAVDFASLLLLGPHETMLVAAGSAFSQCHLNSKERNPIHRTLFSVASLVITVQASGLAFHLLGGTGSAMPITALARPLVGAATVYFLLNTGLVATAIALSTRAPILSTWHNNFLWSAPSYFVGAGSAALRRVVRHARRLLGRAVHLRAALPDLSHLQGLHGAHRRRAAPRPADLGSASGDDRGARARDRRQGSDDADAHPPRAGVRDRASRKSSASPSRRFRASRPRRCCTTSASSPSPSTSCRSRARSRRKSSRRSASTRRSAPRSSPPCRSPIRSRRSS